MEFSLDMPDGLVAGQYKELAGRCFAWHLLATCHDNCPSVFQCSSMRVYEGARTMRHAFLYREAIGSELEFESLTCQVQTGFHYSVRIWHLPVPLSSS